MQEVPITITLNADQIRQLNSILDEKIETTKHSWVRSITKSILLAVLVGGSALMLGIYFDKYALAVGWGGCALFNFLDRQTWQI